MNGNLGLPVIGKLLGHSSAQMTAKYGHVVSDAARLAANAIADKLSEAMNPSDGEGAHLKDTRTDSGLDYEE